MNFKVISSHNIPTKFPLLSTSVYTFFMYYFSAPEWAWTLFILFFILIWAFVIWRFIKEKRIDVFEEEKLENLKEKKSKFQERLDLYKQTHKNAN